MAGRIFALILLLVSGLCFAANDTVDALIARADQVKTANNSEFQTLLTQLDAQASGLSAAQGDWLEYLHAWQLGYGGQYLDGVSAFESLLARIQDPNLRARAMASLINDQANAAHFEDAYANLSALLDSLPEVQNHYAHFLGLIVAALLYNQAGQYELSLSYIDQALAYDQSERATCTTLATKAETLYKLGKLRTNDAQIRVGLDSCKRIGDVLYANLIRIFEVKVLFDQGQFSEALKLLEPHDKEVVATNSAAMISNFRSLLAGCLLRTGNLEKAKKSAQSAIDYGIKQTFSKPVADAYKVLYEIAKRQGDDPSALAYYEKYATADKAYLNDTSARALAFQIVHQQVLDKKRQIGALSEQNKVLQLKQQVDEKSTETRRLYILLLLAGLVIVVGWAYRTKRSQLKFQTLARRDGLTGISNRQHFIDAAQERLRYSAKNARDAVVIAMDLDHFKSINDMHGHAAGDATLKRVVAVCKDHLKSIDLFGRLGGEEFAILLPDCNATVAAQRANEMREAIAGLSASKNTASDVVVTASFGIATTPVCGYNLTTLLAHADTALYSAKHAGRNRVVVHRAGAEARRAQPDGGIEVSESTDG